MEPVSWAQVTGRAEFTSEQLKRRVHKLSKSQKVDLRKSPLKLWTCKRLKFNYILA